MTLQRSSALGVRLAMVIIGLMAALGFALPWAYADEPHPTLTADAGDSQGPPSYQLDPIRITYGDGPLNLAAAISEAASAAGDTLDLTGATYRSSNERAATIDDAGLLTIHHVGNTTVTATLADDQGTVTGLVSVLPYNLSTSDEATIAPIGNQNYTGAAVTPPLTVTVGETTLVAGVDYTASYINNVEVGTATAVANGLGDYTGNLSTTFAIVSSGGSDAPSGPDTPDRPTVIRVYRLYNPYSGWHLYTESANEYDVLGADGWQQEGVAWYSPETGPDIYRLYNPYSGWHLYTESVNERDVLSRDGWQPEGVAFHSAPATGIPIFRLYNPGNGLHLFTESRYECQVLINLAYGAWDYEGVAWYGERVGTAPVG